MPSGRFLDSMVAERMVDAPASLSLCACEHKGWESGRLDKVKKIGKAKRLQIVWKRPSFVGSKDPSGVGTVQWYLVVEQCLIWYFRILLRSYRQCYHLGQCGLSL